MFELWNVFGILYVVIVLAVVGLVVATLIAAIRALNAYTRHRTLETELLKAGLEVDARGGDRPGDDETGTAPGADPAR